MVLLADINYWRWCISTQNSKCWWFTEIFFSRWLYINKSARLFIIHFSNNSVINILTEIELCSKHHYIIYEVFAVKIIYNCVISNWLIVFSVEVNQPIDKYVRNGHLRVDQISLRESLHTLCIRVDGFFELREMSSTSICYGLITNDKFNEKF